MNQRTKLLSTLALAALVAMAGRPSATAAATDHGPGALPLAEKLATLGLTAQQQEQIHGILHRYQPTTGPLLQQVVTARRAWRDTIRAAVIDEAAIRAQAAKVASLETDLAVQRARIVHDLRAVLTPEQIEKLKDLQAAQDARVDAWRERVAKRIGTE